MCFELKYRRTQAELSKGNVAFSERKTDQGAGCHMIFPASEVMSWIFFFKVNLFCCCCVGFFLSFVLLRMEMLCNLIVGKLDKHGLNIKRSCQFYEYSPPFSVAFPC